MKPSFVAFFLAFSLALSPAAALAASQSSGSNRYFVQTTKSVWRSVLGARNVVDGGFTADLSDLQVRISKFAGLKLVSVKKFNILIDVATTSVLPSVVASASITPMPSPAQPVSWGIRYVLRNSTLSKTTGGDGVTVAILDTGVDREHPDLKSRITGCADYADPAKAFIDDSCADDNGHGTHIAGIIAADGGPDATGIWGIAPEANLLVYKVCNRAGLCMSDDIAVAMRDAVDNGANIIVLGLGGEAESSFIDDAAAYAAEHDVMVVAAAGNNGPYDDSMDWPAHDPAVVSVGALTSDEAVADFSSRGTNETTKPYTLESGDIEFVAPGVNIESTFKDGGYAILSGTSMAAPHVAGLAARVWAKEAKHPAEATRALLHDMSVDIGAAGDDNTSGWGVPVY